jgi:sugar-specific transcriptional regulator TrmB
MTLEGFGFSRAESEVYVYLAKVGPSRVKELSFGLRLTKQQLCPALNGLRKKGVVASRPEHDRLFSAIAFEELLCLFMRINSEKVKVIEETKQEIVESWKETINEKDKS